MTNITVTTPDLSFEFSYNTEFDTRLHTGKPFEVREVRVTVTPDGDDFNASATVYGKRIQANGNRVFAVGPQWVDFEDTRPFVDDAVARVQTMLGTSGAVTVL